MMRTLALILVLTVALTQGQFQGKHWETVFTAGPIIEVNHGTWYDGAMSDDGTIQLAIRFSGDQGTHIYEKNDGVWSKDVNSPADTYRSVAMSSNGDIQYAVSLTKVYVRFAGDDTWTEDTDIQAEITDAGFKSVATDGSTVLVAGTYLYTGTVNGWERVTDSAVDQQIDWDKVYMSGDGSVQLGITLSTLGPTVFFEKQAGGTAWVAGTISGYWGSMAVSRDGSVQLACQFNINGKLYERLNGVWTEVQDTAVSEHTKGWKFVEVSADGSVRVAVPRNTDDDDFKLYTKQDSNPTWVAVPQLMKDEQIVGTFLLRFYMLNEDGSEQTIGYFSNINGAIIMELTATSPPTFHPTPQPSMEPTPEPTDKNTWLPRLTLPHDKFFRSVAVSNDGAIKVVATKYRIYNKLGYEEEWVLDLELNRFEATVFRSIAISADGSKRTAVQFQGRILENSGTNGAWEVTMSEEKNWRSVAMSDDGSLQVAITDEECYFKTTDADGWILVQSTADEWLHDVRPPNKFIDVAMSADGSKMTIVGDYVLEWNPNQNKFLKASGDINSFTRDWRAVAISPDGSHQTVVGQLQIWEKSNGGEYVQTDSSERHWQDVAMSYSGKYQTVVSGVSGTGNIYTKFEDATWEKVDGVGNDFRSVAMSNDGLDQVACNHDVDEHTLLGVFRSGPADTDSPQTPQPTPQPTPQSTPQSAPDPTPQPTPQPTLQSAPDPTPEPTPPPALQSAPDPTPQPTLPSAPDPTPQPTPQPTPAAAPQPAPKPTVGAASKSTAPPADDPWLSPTAQTVTGMFLGGVAAGGTIYVATGSDN